jgi:hypothetical protein
MDNPLIHSHPAEKIFAYDNIFRAKRTSVSFRLRGGYAVSKPLHEDQQGFESAKALPKPERIEDRNS